ncbi:MAG: hypothetical protein HWE25_15135 [Alphaproteobacteria bacterium]|nr:hypothetical protein [Alphaproteobacteria bacterium]
MTQHTEINEESGTPCGEGVAAPSFQAILEHIEGTDEARIIAHQPDGIAEFGVVGWAMHALETESYLVAKRGLMADEGLTRGDLGHMSAAARVVFEARVFDRLRTDYAMGAAIMQKEKRGKKKHLNMCFAVPIPDP